MVLVSECGAFGGWISDRNVGHRGGESQIYMRGIGEMTARAVPGTEGARMPFFSPDGQWLGIYSGGMIKNT